MDDLSELLVFERVIREGSLTKAGRALGMPKSTISSKITRLEERFGVQLLVRTTRSLRPTDLGAALYEHCTHLLQSVDAARLVLESGIDRPSGTLRLSVPPLFARAFLGSVLVEYGRLYPEVRIQVTLMDRHVNLIEEQLDLAIRVGTIRDASLRIRRLGNAIMSCVASPAYLAAHGEPALPENLSEHRGILMFADEDWVFPTEDGENMRVAPQPTLVVNSLELCKEAAMADMGITRLPSFFCTQEIASGALRPLFRDAPAPRMPISVVFPPGRHATAKVRAFVDILTARVTADQLGAGNEP